MMQKLLRPETLTAENRTLLKAFVNRVRILVKLRDPPINTREALDIVANECHLCRKPSK